MLRVRFIACNTNSKQLPSHFHSKTCKLASIVISDCVPPPRPPVNVKGYIITSGVARTLTHVVM